MQTKSRLSTARNRPTYTHDVTAPFLSGRNPEWDAFNRAEYFTWRALRTVGFGASALERAQERVSYAAKARLFLRMSAEYRERGRT